MPYRHAASPFWHYDFQIRGRRFHGSCGTTDFQEARAIEAAARVRATAQVQEPTGIFTLSQAIGTYYADVAAYQPSARTALSQGKAILANLDPDTRLPDLTMAMVQRHVSIRRATVANATVNRELQLLGRALRHMARIHAATVPVLDLRSLECAEPQERVRELTADEQARLFQHLRPDLHPLVLLAIMTGARLSALTGLKWTDVDLAASVLTFREKGARLHRFPVNAELRAFLSALPRATQLPDARYVLTYEDHRQKSRPRRRLQSSGGIMATIKAAMVAAGIEDFRFHDFRHTFGTRLLRQTGNLKLVSRLLGHAQIETTVRYAHVIDDDLRQALDGYSVAPVPKKSPKRAASD